MKGAAQNVLDMSVSINVPGFYLDIACNMTYKCNLIFPVLVQLKAERLDSKNTDYEFVSSNI